MLRLLADENFNGDVVRALLLRQPDLDIVRVQDVGLAGIADPDILAWAAVNDRIILTHDRATLPQLFILDDRFPVGHATDELLLLITCSEQPKWRAAWSIYLYEGVSFPACK